MKRLIDRAARAWLLRRKLLAPRPLLSELLSAPTPRAVRNPGAVCPACAREGQETTSYDTNFDARVVWRTERLERHRCARGHRWTYDPATRLFEEMASASFGR